MADRKKEVVRKIAAHVRKEFAGDYDAAFSHYATKKTNDGMVNADELRALLDDADIGSSFTRGLYVSGIMREVDRDMDGKISGQEFDEIMRHGQT